MIRARKKHVEEHENHERWLVSYADFITLMFAFFVVLFATSQSDQAKTKAVSEAVEKALQDGQFTSKVMSVLQSTDTTKQVTSGLQGLQDLKPPKDPAQKPVELTPSLKKLTAELKEDIEAGRIQINLEPRGLVISLREGAFFAPGGAEVAEKGYPTIGKLAAIMKPISNPVRLEGHTDSTPIRNSRYRNNWELSASRSIAVLELLRDRFAIPQPRMAIVGYADNVAVESNDTEDGRARNRRVDITILNEAAALKEAS